MYDPVTARFLQEDAYKGSKGNPLSLNLYTYVVNNPLVYWDPTGFKPVLLRTLAIEEGGEISWDGGRKIASVTLDNVKRYYIVKGHKNVEYGVDNRVIDVKGGRIIVDDGDFYNDFNIIKYYDFGPDFYYYEGRLILTSRATIIKPASNIPTNLYYVNSDDVEPNEIILKGTEYAKERIDYIFYHYNSYWGYSVSEYSMETRYRRKLEKTKADAVNSFLLRVPIWSIAIGIDYSIMKQDPSSFDPSQPGVLEFVDVIMPLDELFYDSEESINIAEAKYEYIKNTDYKYLIHSVKPREEFIEKLNSLISNIKQRSFNQYDSLEDNIKYKKSVIDYIELVKKMNKEFEEFEENLDYKLKEIE